MKKVLLLCLLVGACAAVAQVKPPSNATVFSNLDDKPSDDNALGWGSCTSCAGGAAPADLYYTQRYTYPALDGVSTQFHMSGPAWSNVLWWNKVGAHDNLSHFQFDFWMQFGSDAVTNAQALEFDTFQFANGIEYMFGTQCDYAVNAWDVWNPKQLKWISTGIPCGRFTANVWYHITWNVHRGTTRWDRYVHYDTLTITQYGTDGVTVASSKTYSVNRAYPPGPMPAGWSDDLGVQFQMDLAGEAGAMSEWADEVTLTAW